MHTPGLARVLVIVAAVTLAACGTSPTSPSGVCASDEEDATLLYGPPLSVSKSGDTTTYTWAAGKLNFIAEGSTCVEQQVQQ